MRRSLVSGTALSVLALFSLSLATPVSAQQFFDGANTISNSVDGGNGAWDNATTNWSDVDGDNNAAYNSAVSTNFGGGNTGPASGGTVTVDGGGITLSSDVIFGATGDNSIYTIEGGDLTVAAAGGTTFDVSDVSGGVGNDATISSIITGADELTKSGIGTMTLNAANTYTGDTEVNGGTLRIGASERIANTSNLVMGGGTFDLNNFTETVADLSGSGAITTGGGNGRLNVNQANNLTYSGSISGATTFNTDYFVKTGGGTLTISGSNSTTGSGIFAINGGTVEVSGGNAIGDNNIVSLAGPSTLSLLADETVGILLGNSVDTINLNANTLTLAGVAASANLDADITGTGNLVVNGADQNLREAVTYTGTTTVTAGTLELNTNGALASTGVSVNGGTLRVVNGGLAAGTTASVSSGALTINTTAESITSLSTSGGTVSGDAVLTVTSGAANAVQMDGGTISSDLNVAGGLTVSSGTTSTLSGSNTFGASGITVDGGTLTLGSDNAAGGAGGQITTTGSVINYTNGVNMATPIAINSNTTQLQALAGVTAEQSGVISEVGGARPLEKIGDGTLVLSAVNTYTGLTTVSAGTLDLSGGAAIVDTGAVTVAAGGTLQITTAETIGSVSGAGNVVLNANLTTGEATNTTLSGIVSSAGNLVKQGAGTFTLTGTNTAANSFSGIANVNAGTLLIDGTFGDLAGPTTDEANVNVASGATLGGSGTIRGSVNVADGGILAPGNSPGVLTMTNLSLNNASVLNFELGAAANPASVLNDRIDVTNDLTLDGTLNVVSATQAGYYRVMNFNTGLAGTLTDNGLVLGTVPGGFTGANRIYTIPSGGGLNGEVNLFLAGSSRLSQFWDGGTGGPSDGAIAGGGGTWSSANVNWTDSSGNFNDTWQSGEGTFGAAGGAVAVSGTQSFERLNFTTNGYSLNGGTLTLLNDTIPPALAVPAAGPTGSLATINVAGAVSTAINSVIGGGVGLLKIGDGTLQLGGNNTYSGDTRIAAGTLDLIGPGADRIPNFGRVIIDNVASAGLLVTTSEEIGSLEGGGTTGGRVEILAGQTLTTGSRTTDTTFDGIVKGAGTLTKVGTSTFTLTGTNSAPADNFTGMANVDDGVLRVTGRFGDVDGTIASGSILTVNTGGTLQGAGNGTTTGRVDLNVVVASGGTLQPGQNGLAGQEVGLLTIGGSLDLQNGSISRFDLSTPNIVGGANNDLVNVDGTLTIGGGATLNLANANVSGLYRLFNVSGGAITGNFADGNISTANGTATTYAIGATQLNARVSLGGQIVQFWDGADSSGAGAGTQGGTGVWSSVNPNWTEDQTIGEINDTWRRQVGVFTGAAGTVTVAGTQDFQGLQFATDSYTVTGGTLHARGNAVIGGNAAASFFNVNDGVTATVASTIEGNAPILGIDKFGTGRLILSGTNSYTGLTTVGAGILTLQNGNAIVDGAVLADGVAGSVTVAAGATLNVASDETIASLSGVAGSLVTLDATLTTGDAGNDSFAGNASGTGGLVKQGIGTFTLSQTNSYTGMTTVNAGTLELTGAGALASTDININSGGTLRTDGTTGGGGMAVGSDIDIAGTVGLVVGGMLDIDGSESLGAASTLDLNGAGASVDIAANQTLSVGTITTAADSTVTINAGATLAGLANTINNGGIMNVADTGSVTDAGAINNLATGVYNFAGAATFDSDSDDAGAEQIVNDGRINLNGTNAQIVNVGPNGNNDLVNQNAGQVNVNVGRLDVAGTLTNSSPGAAVGGVGGVDIAADGILNVAALINNAGGEVTNAGTLTSTAVVTNNAGASLGNTGTLNGGLTNAGAASNSGTVNDGLANSGTYTQSAGSTNSGTTNTGTVNATAGLFSGAIANNVAGAFNVNGAVTADSTFTNNDTATLGVTGGSFTGITTLTNNSTAAAGVNIAGGTALTAAAVINNTGATITNAGTLNSTAVIANNAGATLGNAGTLNGGLTNAGTASNSGTVNDGLTNSGTYTQTAGSTNDDTTNTGTVNASAGVFSGDIFNNVAGDFNVNGAVTADSAFTNNGTATLDVTGGSFTGITTLTNSSAGSDGAGGTLGGINIASGRLLSAGIINNNAGGEIFLNGGATLQGALTNTGTITAGGANTLNGAVNNTGGTISLANGATGDVLTVNGNLANGAGGQYNLDIAMPTTGVLVDTVAVNGSLTGVLNVHFNSLVQANYDTPGETIVISSTDNSGSSLGAVTVTDTIVGRTDDFVDVMSGPFILNEFVDSGENYVVKTSLNLGTLGGLVGSLSSVQNIVNSAVNRPTSAFVATPIGVEPDTCSPGVYGRMTGGTSTASATTSSPGSSSATSEVSVNYGGFQAGADWGCFNIGGDGASVNLGVLGGVSLGTASQNQNQIVSSNRFTSKNVGAYATYSKGRFFADVQTVFDWTRFEIDSTANNKVFVQDDEFDTRRFTISGSMGYAFSFDDVSVVPTAGFSYSRTMADNVTIDATPGGTLQFNDVENIIGFASVSVARTYILPNETSALQPFVTATIYNDFGKDPTVNYIAPSGSSRTTTTTNFGTYGELSAGVNFRNILQAEDGGLREVSASIRGDMTFNEDLLGGRITAQMRLQF